MKPGFQRIDAKQTSVQPNSRGERQDNHNRVVYPGNSRTELEWRRESNSRSYVQGKGGAADSNDWRRQMPVVPHAADTSINRRVASQPPQVPVVNLSPKDIVERLKRLKDRPETVTTRASLNELTRQMKMLREQRIFLNAFDIASAAHAVENYTSSEADAFLSELALQSNFKEVDGYGLGMVMVGVENKENDPKTSPGVSAVVHKVAERMPAVAGEMNGFSLAAVVHSLGKKLETDDVKTIMGEAAKRLPNVDLSEEEKKQADGEVKKVCSAQMYAKRMFMMVRGLQGYHPEGGAKAVWKALCDHEIVFADKLNKIEKEKMVEKRTICSLLHSLSVLQGKSAEIHALSDKLFEAARSVFSLTETLPEAVIKELYDLKRNGKGEELEENTIDLHYASHELAESMVKTYVKVFKDDPSLKRFNFIIGKASSKEVNKGKMEKIVKDCAAQNGLSARLDPNNSGRLYLEREP